jgi:hypothetical protein
MDYRSSFGRSLLWLGGILIGLGLIASNGSYAFTALTIGAISVMAGIIFLTRKVKSAVL